MAADTLQAGADIASACFESCFRVFRFLRTASLLDQILQRDPGQIFPDRTVEAFPDGEGAADAAAVAPVGAVVHAGDGA